MREIKFRSWIERTKTMEIPDCIANDIDGDKCQIMQYTGLKDKNGLTEIYEGDILLIQDTYTDRILEDGSGPVECCNHLCEVIFENGSFGVLIEDEGDIWGKGFVSFLSLEDEESLLSENKLEIIGNKFENPELLRGD